MATLPFGGRVATVSAVLTVGSSYDGERGQMGLGPTAVVGEQPPFCPRQRRAHGQENTDRGYSLAGNDRTIVNATPSDEPPSTMR